MSRRKPKSLREIRFEKRVSQWWLAKESGVFQSRISLIEREESEVTYIEKVKLAVALDLFPDDIYWPKMPEPVKVPETLTASMREGLTNGD